MWKKLVSQIKSYPLTYILLTTILVVSYLIRIYRTFDLMGFYYDQGRDALAIWDLWHKGKLFLVGPVTGLKGIFLGPFYYYLIAPLYLLGRGNPVYPAIFLAFLSTLALFFLYILGTRMHSRATGLIAATIGAFSYRIFNHSRWLSNPNPILLTSTVFLWSLWEISLGKNDARKKVFWWILSVLMLGLSLQLESASAAFYLPSLAVFTLWQRKVLNRRTLFISGLVFFATLLPQIVFDFRHDNILLNNFRALFFEEKAFRGLTSFIFEERSKYFWRVFSSTLFEGRKEYAVLFLTISFSMLAASYKKFKTLVLPLFGIFLLPPIFGYYLFQGNYGNIYEYYLSGYYLPFILFFAIGMGELWQKKLGVFLVILFFYHFFSLNLVLIRNYLSSTPQTRPIALSDEVAAVDWIFEDSFGTEFNVDVYVPPVIPYSYDYLLLWRGSEKCGRSLCGRTEQERQTVYLILEPEYKHFDRWDSWIARYKKETVLEDEKKFGNVTVQKRKRIR